MAYGTPGGWMRTTSRDPRFFLIDRTGLIRYSFIGKWQDQYPAPDEIMNAIEELLTAE
jgi:hypothetical protein